MKKLSFFMIIFCMQHILHAQPWMPANTTRPVKYADALERYYRVAASTNTDEEEETHGSKKEVKEDKNHLFECWNYYWKSHLDKDGYMVPPVQTVLNWEQYMSQHPAKAERTT